MGLNLKGVFNNDNLTNFVIFLVFVLSLGYLSNKNFEALVFMFLVGGLLYLVCKNIAGAFGLSIILTNLLLSMNYFRVVENFVKNKEGLQEEEEEGVDEEEEEEGVKEGLE